nr:MAG TPA: hypothetical protein [Bacteriophage sp.]
MGVIFFYTKSCQIIKYSFVQLAILTNSRYMLYWL